MAVAAGPILLVFPRLGSRGEEAGYEAGNNRSADSICCLTCYETRCASWPDSAQVRGVQQRLWRGALSKSVRSGGIAESNVVELSTSFFENDGFTLAKTRPRTEIPSDGYNVQCTLSGADTESAAGA